MESSSIRRFQTRCFREYKSSIGLTEHYCFFHGNPVNVLVPIETAVDSLMIVGAYASAKFYVVQGITDVPLLDNDFPFSSESYFDGSRVRTVPSGQELEHNYLAPLGISRSQCWITDIVKVFLFKDGHIRRYESLGFSGASETRSHFDDFAKRSLVWLVEELRLAKPRVVFCLGAEVTAIVFHVSKSSAIELLDGGIHTFSLENTSYRAICLPHPGIVMKRYEGNPWPERLRNEILPNALRHLRRLGIASHVG